MITGAARGIGKAVALKFAQQGADIAFTDLVIDEAGEQTKKELELCGVRVLAIASNAADFNQSHDVVESVVKEFGKIDILVNNAGITKDGLMLKIPNRYMSKLFSKCIISLRLRKAPAFVTPAINTASLLAAEDDISSFAESCTEFLSSIMTNQVMLHMNEMALNLALYAKLENEKGRNFIVKMQKSLQVKGEAEKYADLVITVNLGKINECIYLFELKYLTKTEAGNKSSESAVEKAIKEASAEVLKYKSAIDFKGRIVKAYAMVFQGPECVSCQLR